MLWFAIIKKEGLQSQKPRQIAKSVCGNENSFSESLTMSRMKDFLGLEAFFFIYPMSYPMSYRIDYFIKRFPRPYVNR